MLAKDSLDNGKNLHYQKPAYVHTSFRILYQEYDLDIKLESPSIICFHMFWVLIALLVYSLFYNLLAQ